jgi:hypothetical protein
MESEHVLPRAMSNKVFEALRQKGIPAGKTDYNAQTTVLIYKGAADAKTDDAGGDQNMINTLKATVDEVVAEHEAFEAKAKKAERDAKKKGKKGSADAPRMEMLRLVLDVLNNLLSAYAQNAQARTNAAIVKENQANGAKRGKPGTPEPPTPGAGAVAAAASQQKEDIMNQLRARLR